MDNDNDFDFDFDYVNFTDDIKINPKITISDDYNNYNETTTEQYRTMRLYKIDPIMNEPIPNHLIFEFKYKWDPITGHRKEIDNLGPLCFNAWNLYQYYYSNRFNGLWNPPVQQFQGYYGDLINCGKDMFINGRPCPEKYLYRLPIIDCYLKKSHNYSIITMGPILTDEEIDFIDIIISNYRKNKPTLKTLKEYYDQALNNSPDISELKKLNSSMTDKELGEKYNRNYVDKLVKI
jgi:hypothetical protein